jgi:hypothetical protein
MKTAVQKYLSEIGRRGGTKSRRTLTPEQSRAMTAAREAKRKKKKPDPLFANIRSNCKKINNGVKNLYAKSA